MIYQCHCCGVRFESKKKQDPQRDKRFGTCHQCWPEVREQRIKFDMENPERLERDRSRYA